MEVKINWEIEIEKSQCIGMYGKRVLCLTPKRDLILGYNQEDEYNFHKKGKLVRISQGVIHELFETPERIMAQAIDENQDIYFTSYDMKSEYSGKTSRKTLTKIGRDNKMLWEYTFKGNIETSPVIYCDSILIYDMEPSIPRVRGRLLRMGLDGKLIWEKHFASCIWDDPLILKNRNAMIMGFRYLLNRKSISEIYLMDIDGNILVKKNGRDESESFSQDCAGTIYGCPYGTITAYDEKLNDVWAYRPPMGRIFYAPISDSQGNLYTTWMNKLFSLDSKAKVRWIVDTVGYTFPPYLLEDGKLLVAQSEGRRKKAGEQRDITYFEIYSDEGINLLKFDLPGGVCGISEFKDNTIYLVMDCNRYITGKEYYVNSVKVYFITLS